MKRGKESKREGRKEEDTKGREKEREGRGGGGKENLVEEGRRYVSQRDPQCGSDLTSGETKNRRHRDCRSARRFGRIQLKYQHLMNGSEGTVIDGCNVA